MLQLAHPLRLSEFPGKPRLPPRPKWPDGASLSGPRTAVRKPYPGAADRPPVAKTFSGFARSGPSSPQADRGARRRAPLALTLVCASIEEGEYQTRGEGVKGR